MEPVNKSVPRRDIAVRKTDGNPEGKGVNGLMLDWAHSTPRGVAVKPQRQVLAEFFTSMLVLSASFKFRPAVGGRHYLYREKGEWQLSLIAPEDWTPGKRTGFVGTCVLQQDMTWTIAPSATLAEDEHLAEALGRFYDGFAEMMDTDLTLEEILPFYVGRLPYYQRLYASALSRSVRATVSMSETGSKSCRQWNLLLPAGKNAPRAISQLIRDAAP